LVRDVELHTGAAYVIMERRRSLYRRVLLGVVSGFLVINVCNHGEHYETPYIYIYIYIERESERVVPLYPLIQYPRFQLSAFNRGPPKNLKIKENGS
jgi:hypothetical protein